ncbi:MAG: choice-of-anchor tandem repeat NxxGxxAF-containing protein [Acidobacteriota bacterium]
MSHTTSLFRRPPFLYLALASLCASQALAASTLSRGDQQCPITVVAEEGQAVPGGGVLDGSAFSQPRTLNRHGVVAFFNGIDGDVRNQGIFTSGPSGLEVIVRGCGNGAGGGSTVTCGDPSPIGGTFTGLFGGSLGPRINDAGDVLFMADVVGGSSNRGLFLFRAATDTIEKVVSVGDASPLGDTIAGFANGTINGRGDVAFLAWDTNAAGGAFETYVARWNGGNLEKVAGPGDTSPDGTIFLGFSTVVSGFVDGTDIPTAPTPYVDEDGTIVVYAGVSGGDPGMLSIDGDGQTWLVQTGDMTPVGGTFLFFLSNVVKRAGRVVFSAASPTGIYVGTPGSWQPAWSSGTLLDGLPVESFGGVSGFAPPIDDAGQITFLLDVTLPGGDVEERLARWNESDGLFTLVAQDDPAPNGGLFNSIRILPTVNAVGDVVFSASVAQGFSIFSGHFMIRNCAEVLFSDGFEDGTTDAWASSVGE